MSTQKNSVPYTASDIEKYRKGELSAREMHDLEQAALDDPFLADAIEGLMQHPMPQEDLTDLRERLEIRITRDTRHNRIMIIRRRITLAAALLLLLGIGYTFVYHHPDRAGLAPQPAHVTSPTTALATTPATTPSPGPVAIARSTPSRSIAIHNTPPANTPAIAAARRRLPTTTTNQADYFSSQARSADKGSALEKDSAKSKSFALSTKSKSFALSEKQLSPPTNYYLPPPNPNQYLTLPSSKQALGSVTIPLVLSGKVLDLHDHPLAGAFLALNKNSGFGTTTDEQGQFRISLHPFDTTGQLSVYMIGYDHASLAVNALFTGDLQNNIIRLTPHTTALREVVIEGYGKATEVIAPSDDSDEKLDTLWKNAAPVVSREAYLQYLTGAKKKLGLDTTITGTETLSFIVSRDGSLSSFKIERSLSPAHDAGIIRLVTDGPAWHLIRGKEVRAAVTINF